MLANHWNYKLVTRKGHVEKITGESMTLPDEAFTVKEIMQRFATGSPISNSLERGGVFDSGASFDSDDLEKINGMDIVDRTEVALRNAKAVVDGKALAEKLELDAKEAKRKRVADKRKSLVDRIVSQINGRAQGDGGTDKIPADQ